MPASHPSAASPKRTEHVPERNSAVGHQPDGISMATVGIALPKTGRTRDVLRANRHPRPREFRKPAKALEFGAEDEYVIDDHRYLPIPAAIDIGRVRSSTVKG